VSAPSYIDAFKYEPDDVIFQGVFSFSKLMKAATLAHGTSSFNKLEFAK